MYFYLTGHLRLKSKDRGSMICDLRPAGLATCGLRLLRFASAPASHGSRTNKNTARGSRAVFSVF